MGNKAPALRSNTPNPRGDESQSQGEHDIREARWALRGCGGSTAWAWWVWRGWWAGGDRVGVEWESRERFA